MLETSRNHVLNWITEVNTQDITPMDSVSRCRLTGASLSNKSSTSEARKQETELKAKEEALDMPEVSPAFGMPNQIYVLTEIAQRSQLHKSEPPDLDGMLTWLTFSRSKWTLTVSPSLKKCRIVKVEILAKPSKPIDNKGNRN